LGTSGNPARCLGLMAAGERFTYHWVHWRDRLWQVLFNGCLLAGAALQERLLIEIEEWKSILKARSDEIGLFVAAGRFCRRYLSNFQQLSFSVWHQPSIQLSQMSRTDVAAIRTKSSSSTTSSFGYTTMTVLRPYWNAPCHSARFVVLPVPPYRIPLY